MKRDEARRPLSRAALVLYGAVLLLLLFGRTPERIETTYLEAMRRNINWIPFRSIRMYFYLLRTGGEGVPAYYRYAFINFFGNILLFIPLGTLLPAAIAALRAFWRSLLCALCVMLAVETAQLVSLRGSFDVDDIALNLLGVAVGYLLWRVAHSIRKRGKEQKKQ